METNLIIYGQVTWSIFDLRGNFKEKRHLEGKGHIHEIRMSDCIDNYTMIIWTGNLDDPKMFLETYEDGVSANKLEGHSVIALNKKQTKVFLCSTEGSNTVSGYELKDGQWVKGRTFEVNEEQILMLEVSRNEKWCCATILRGFKLWHVETDTVQQLFLPHGVRNITKGFQVSSNIILSAGDKLAVTRIRRVLFCWDMETGTLVK